MNNSTQALHPSISERALMLSSIIGAFCGAGFLLIFFCCFQRRFQKQAEQQTFFLSLKGSQQTIETQSDYEATI